MGMGLERPLKAPTLSVWIVTLGLSQSVSKEDFERCSKAVDKSCVPKHSFLKGETAWRYIVGCLLPQMVMRKHHISRDQWNFFKTKVIEGTGKPYIHLKPQSSDEPLAMGFSNADTGAAMVFAHSFGPKHQVINLGVGMQIATPDVSPEAYVTSHLHMLTAREEHSISLKTHDPATSVRRLNTLIIIKEAYIRAIGQPVGFDFARIDISVPDKFIHVDDQPLSGWHIRLFAANLNPTEALRRQNAPLAYQVAVAVFRGGKGVKFRFDNDQKELNSYVSFYDVNEVVKAVPRLGEYDAPSKNGQPSSSTQGFAMPPLDQIPLSGKASMTSINTVRPDHKGKEREKDFSREKHLNAMTHQNTMPSIGGYPQPSATKAISQHQPLGKSQTLPPSSFPSKVPQTNGVPIYPTSTVTSSASQAASKAPISNHYNNSYSHSQTQPHYSSTAQTAGYASARR